jgi:hypothetical protein
MIVEIILREFLVDIMLVDLAADGAKIVCRAVPDASDCPVWSSGTMPTATSAVLG